MFTILTATVGLVIGFAVLEAGLRVAGFSDLDLYRPDDVLGYTLTPGMSGWYSREGRSWVEINSDGARDVEHSIDKPAGVYRVAVIGDSFVEALQVDTEKAFGNFIAQNVGDCDQLRGRQIEVMTFGTSGYSTAQELLTLRSKVWRYSPDLVMLVMTTNNDITDNVRYFKNSPIPYFEVKDGELRLDDSFRTERKFVVRSAWYSRLGVWLKNHLRFVQAIGLAQRNYKYWRSRAATPVAENEPASTPAADAAFEAGIDSQIYRPPGDDNWRTAWDVSERLLAQMSREVGEHNARFAVIIGSNGVQVLPDQSVRKEFAKRLGVDDLNYPNRRITSFCNSNAIPVLDLVPEMSEYAARTGTTLHGFEGNFGYGHWNPDGHKLVGEIIGRHLCELLK